MLFAHSDWLTRRWLASTIHLRAAGARDFHISDRLSHIKYHFGPLIIQLVWYILKQLFTSVSVKVMDIYLAASQLSKYPLLFTSTSVNNIIVNYLQIVMTVTAHRFLFSQFFLVLYMESSFSLEFQ